MLKRFLSTQERATYEKFLAIRQEGTVAEYRHQFEVMAAPLKDISEQILGVFMNGLRVEIQAEVRMRQPGIMDLAQRVEDRDLILGKSRDGRGNTFLKNQGFGGSRSELLAQTAAVVEQKNNVRQEILFKKLTDSECQAKSDEGLCLRCDEKYSVGHGCKNKKMQVLLVDDEVALKERNESDKECYVNLYKVGDVVELSIKSVVGLSTTNAMKIKETIEQQQVVVLIASGTTHNFISSKLVKKLAIPITKTSNYGVLVGSGLSVKGQGVCQSVVLSLQALTIVEDFLPIDLSDWDVIVSMKWLHTVGAMQVNYKTLTFKFKLGEDMVTLQGDPDLSKATVG